ncbi:MAG: response regulator transcription factor, partial [Thiobacillus sp.]
TEMWPHDELKPDEHFLARYSQLCHFCEHTFSDIYRNYTDLNDILALTDAEGRLICIHSSPEVLASAIREMGLRCGIQMTESICGSNAITLALHSREAMISSRPDYQRARFANRATVAVPLLDADQQAMGCIAIFNTSEGSLGEKLLLAKFIAREISRVHLNAAGLSAPTPLQAHDMLGVATGNGTASPPPLSSLMERRNGDRRQLQRAAASSVKLTTRQLQVLQLFAQGKGYKEIARAIGITSYKTVEEHLDAVRGKLDVTHRRECIQKAIALGLL